MADHTIGHASGLPNSIVSVRNCRVGFCNIHRFYVCPAARRTKGCPTSYIGQRYQESNSGRDDSFGNQRAIYVRTK